MLGILRLASYELANHPFVTIIVGFALILLIGYLAIRKMAKDAGTSIGGVFIKGVEDANKNKFPAGTNPVKVTRKSGVNFLIIGGLLFIFDALVKFALAVSVKSFYTLLIFLGLYIFFLQRSRPK